MNVSSTFKQSKVIGNRAPYSDNSRQTPVKVLMWNTADYWKMRATVEEKANLYAKLTEYRQAIGIFKSLIITTTALLIVTSLLIVCLIISNWAKPTTQNSTKHTVLSGKILYEASQKSPAGRVLYVPKR